MNGKLEADKMFKAIIADLARMAIRQAITQPLFASMSMAFAAKGASFNGSSANFAQGSVQAFADGGAFTNSVATSPTMAPMALFGEAGPEAIMPLTRNAQGELGVKAQVPATAQNMKIEIVNQSNEELKATTSQTKFDGENFVISVVVDAIRRNKGGMRDVMGGR